MYIDGVESDCSGLGFYYAGYGYGLDSLFALMYSDMIGVTQWDNVVVSEN